MSDDNIYAYDADEGEGHWSSPCGCHPACPVCLKEERKENPAYRMGIDAAWGAYENIVFRGLSPDVADTLINGELHDAAIAYNMQCDDRAGEDARSFYPRRLTQLGLDFNPDQNMDLLLATAAAFSMLELERVQRRYLRETGKAGA